MTGRKLASLVLLTALTAFGCGTPANSVVRRNIFLIHGDVQMAVVTGGIDPATFVRDGTRS